MKKVLFALSIIVCLSSAGQDVSGPAYGTAIGAKFSSGVAFSYKKFITSRNAFEAQAMVYKAGLRAIGLYEFHFPIEGINGLAWYVGPGAHIGLYTSRYIKDYNTSTDLGIDGVLGIDYKIPNVPINLSLDWQPSFSILGNAGLQPSFGGIGVRYVLK